MDLRLLEPRRVHVVAADHQSIQSTPEPVLLIARGGTCVGLGMFVFRWAIEGPHIFSLTTTAPPLALLHTE